MTTLEGESNSRPGYAMNGEVLAIGYMKGIMEAPGIPYEKWSLFIPSPRYSGERAG
jgi:hypothetical protein